MSGPKLSAAELERMKQEQLERERQAALMKLMEARGQYVSVCKELKKAKESFIALLNSIHPVYRSDIEHEVLKLVNEIDGGSINSSNYEDYIAATQIINKKMTPWKKKIEEVMREAQSKSINESNLIGRNDALKKFLINGVNPSEEVESVIIDFSCNFDEKLIKELLQKTLAHFKDRIDLKSEPRLDSFDRKAIKAITQLSVSKDSFGSIKTKIQQIVNEEENQIRLIKQFDSLYDEYVSLSLILALEPEEKNMMTIDSVSEKVEKLKEEYRRRDEMDYIANQINDVMIEQGYSLVSSQVLKKKNDGETEYSLYKEEGQAGVAVYTDESGAVMMQMTVLGDGGEITDSDREFSYQKQIDFCSKHKDLIDALADRGVYLKQKSYQAPNRKHTFKVNVSGQSDASSSSKVKPASKVDRRARRRSGNKKMRSM